MSFVKLNGMDVIYATMALNTVAAVRDSSSGQWLDVGRRVDLLALTNRFINVSGPCQSTGYFAVNRDTKNRLEGRDIRVELIDGNRKREFSKLQIVRATSMAPIATYSDQLRDLYVIEVADRRHLGNNPFLRLDFDGYKMFNVPAPAYSEDVYYEDTTNPDTVLPWTWQEVFDELWPSWLTGESPEIPSAAIPSADPVGFDFRGMTSYQAYIVLCQHLGVDLAFGSDGTYTLINTGDNDDEQTTTNDRIYEANRAALDEDVEWNEPSKMRCPSGVKVHFQKTSIHSGSEDTYPVGSGQWYTDMFHVETVEGTAVSTFPSDDASNVIADTYHQIFDDMPCWVDPFSGSISNSSDLTTRAEERAASFYKGMVRESLRKHWVHSGIMDFELCASLSAISYVQQHRRGGAWTTESRCDPRFMMAISGGELVPEVVKPVPPWQWRSVPIYPYETAFVRIDGAASGGVHPATEVRQNPSDLSLVNGIEVGVVNAN